MHKLIKAKGKQVRGPDLLHSCRGKNQIALKMQVPTRADYVYSTWRIVNFFIHVKSKVNSGEKCH